MKVRYDYFKSSFFLSALLEWNKLELEIRSSASVNTFKQKLLKFMRPCYISICDIYNLLEIKLLTRLHLGFSHLHGHKFRHCFQDTLKPLCECVKGIESIMNFFLHSTNFLLPRQILFQEIKNIDGNILS